MNWAKIVENSSDLVQTDLKKEIKKEEQEIVYNPYSVLDFRNVEDEFLDNYIRKIENISFEFKEFIYNNYLPFMDKNINVKYNLYDFIKDNCNEYNKLYKEIEVYNNQLIEEYNKEMEELEKEYEEEEELGITPVLK
jgi:hypothetical protein